MALEPGPDSEVSETPDRGLVSNAFVQRATEAREILDFRGALARRAAAHSRAGGFARDHRFVAFSVATQQKKRSSCVDTRTSLSLFCAPTGLPVQHRPEGAGLERTEERKGPQRPKGASCQEGCGRRGGRRGRHAEPRRACGRPPFAWRSCTPRSGGRNWGCGRDSGPG